MAVELAAAGIRVNCISPGPTETGQVQQYHDAATREAYYAFCRSSDMDGQMRSPRRRCSWHRPIRPLSPAMC
jgi:NAD(P)-dependent dehydrogenase (short-subunit alcohol dehydrogenase family)